MNLVIEIFSFAMEVEQHNLTELPTYEQACNFSRKKTLTNSLFNDALHDPALICITIAVVVGSSSLLSGLFLLCVASKAIQDEHSESILLIGVGFFIISMSCIAWKLTAKPEILQFIDTLNTANVV